MFSLAGKSLYVAALDLWIDSMRMRSRCYVSHGHSDHARIHETIVTTPHNAEVCKLRLGAKGRPARQQPLLPSADSFEITYETHGYNEPWLEDDHRLTMFSAGHVLGSAQLMIEAQAAVSFTPEISSWAEAIRASRPRSRNATSSSWNARTGDRSTCFRRATKLKMR